MTFVEKVFGPVRKMSATTSTIDKGCSLVDDALKARIKKQFPTEASEILAGINQEEWDDRKPNIQPGIAMEGLDPIVTRNNQSYIVERLFNFSFTITAVLIVLSIYLELFDDYYEKLRLKLL